MSLALMMFISIMLLKDTLALEAYLVFELLESSPRLAECLVEYRQLG
jgi:hypothetical protein